MPQIESSHIEVPQRPTAAMPTTGSSDGIPLASTAGQAHILVVDDNPDDRALVARELEKAPFRVRISEITSQGELEAAIASDDYDVVVTDYQLQWSTGLEVLRLVKARHPGLPVIMFTGSGSEEIAVAAMKIGLDDYITKTARHYPRISYAVAGVLQRVNQQRELARQEQVIAETRRVAAEQLGLSEERFRAVPEASPDAFSLLEPIRDADGRIVDFQIVFANEPAARLARRSRADLHGRRLLETFPALHSTGMFDRYVTVLQSGMPWVGETEYEGEANPVFARVAIARVGEGIAVSAVDVTERHNAELALIEADRHKDEFLAMLAHELRNPLAPIRTAGELLARILQDDVRAQEILDTLRRQVSHLTRLVEDLLDISRITRNRIELRREIVEVGTVLAHAVETVESHAAAQGHDLQVQSDGSMPRVYGDPARLVQCVVNLLSNAVKFTVPGGRIRLKSSSRDGFAVIEVEDNGLGIAPTLLDKIFDLFVQSERGLDRSQGGLGIGLTVVRRLVEMHGGQVSAYSEGLGRGATFTIRLPLVQQSAVPAESTSVATLNDLHVLVVDDNLDAANTLALMLQLDGQEARAVYSAEEALREVSSLKPNVILMDIGLPGMDGYELIARVRELHLDPAPICIAITGYGQPGDRARSLDAGFDEHLAKPVDYSELANRIAELRSAARRAESQRRVSSENAE